MCETQRALESDDLSDHLPISQSTMPNAAIVGESTPLSSRVHAVLKLARMPGGFKTACMVLRYLDKERTDSGCKIAESDVGKGKLLQHPSCVALADAVEMIQAWMSADLLQPAPEIQITEPTADPALEATPGVSNKQSRLQGDNERFKARAHIALLTAQLSGQNTPCPVSMYPKYPARCDQEAPFPVSISPNRVPGACANSSEHSPSLAKRQTLSA